MASNNESNASGSNLDISAILAAGTGIVKRAADILEINVAQGIMAAQKLERKFLNVDQLRTTNDTETLQKFRKDAHEAMDILFDTMIYTTQSIVKLTEKLEKQGAESASAGNKAGGSGNQIPTLQPPQPLQPGESTEIPLILSNDQGKETLKISFKSIQLTDTTGEVILSRNITFPESSLELAPGVKDKLVIKVHIPKSAKPGTYSGILQSQELKSVKALIIVEVATSEQ